MYQPSSMTEYFQPYFATPASTVVFALKSASSIVSPYASQLFQPIGGVGAGLCACNETANADSRPSTETITAKNDLLRDMGKHITHPVSAGRLPRPYQSWRGSAICHAGPPRDGRNSVNSAGSECN